MLEQEFHKTRLKIAGVFFLTIFSLIFITNIISLTRENILLREFEEFRIANLPRFRNMVNQNAPAFEDEFKEKIAARQSKVVITTVILQVLLSLFGAIISYFVSGIVLSPIKKNVENQKKFLKFASHELRTPITAINLISESEDSSKMQSIKEESEKLENLTNKYLELLTNENKTETEDIYLHDFINYVLKDFSRTIQERSLNIENLVQTDFLINANRTSLYAVLRNMLENAVKYNMQNGFLRITLELELVILRIENSIGENTTSIKGYGVGTEIIKYHCGLRNWKYISQNEKKSALSYIQKINFKN
ncbi:HAMP domain-containing histidine kinase [bacterium]|nr:MAG: HAMP domain-containing histidine kinase [bacterium]